MRVLLHTPLKPPDHVTPSGDREMARGLAGLLERLGHTVIMPALSRVPSGVPPVDSHLAGERRARRQAVRLIARWRALPAGHPERFDLWFTYHLYYRKPDWLGPLVAPALGVPYVIAEASHAPRRAQGATRLGHRAVERALAAADLVLTVNPRDIAGVKARLRPGARQWLLPPFIDTAPFSVAAGNHRPPVLLSVGMMRTRAKLESYRVLAAALARLQDRPWRAILVGDGPARREVEALMAPFGERVHFAGALPRAACRQSMRRPTFTCGPRSTKPTAWPPFTRRNRWRFLAATSPSAGPPRRGGCSPSWEMSRRPILNPSG